MPKSKSKSAKGPKRSIKWKNAKNKTAAIKKIVKNIEKKAHKRVPRKMPNGNYVQSKTAAPTSIGFRSSYQGPQFNREKAFRVSNTEYLRDVVGTVNFTTTEYSINPGLIDNFPWLGQMGANFEQYVVRDMKYIFTPTCSALTVGSVVMCTDYDSKDVVFTDKQQMLSYTGSCSSNCWVGLTHHVRPNKREALKKYFIRVGIQPANTDIRMYDVGNFILATQGQENDTTIIGELRVSYTIDFYVPKIQSMEESGFMIRGNTGLTGNPTNPFQGFTNVNTAIPFTKFQNQSMGDGSYVNLIEFDSSVIQFGKIGYYFIAYVISRVSGSGTFTSVTTLTYTDTVIVGSGFGLASATVSQLFLVVYCALPGGKVAFTNNLTGTMVTNTDCSVSTLPGSAFTELTYDFSNATFSRKAIAAMKARNKLNPMVLNQLSMLKPSDLPDVKHQERKVRVEVRSGADEEDDGDPIVVPSRQSFIDQLMRRRDVAASSDQLRSHSQPK